MAKWYVGTVIETKPIAENVTGLTVHVPGWSGHVSGQHCDIRLTAPDGYQAVRKYSIASSIKSGETIEFGVQLIPSGEVSPYLCAITPGEQIELRGPLGGYFMWQPDTVGPLVVIGGGSGMVPLMSMLRTRAAICDTRPTLVLVSARTYSKVLYRKELEASARADTTLRLVMTLTDMPPLGWRGYTRRIDKQMLQKELTHFLTEATQYFICGPTSFVEVVADHLVALGVAPRHIYTERFGGVV